MRSPVELLSCFYTLLDERRYEDMVQLLDPGCEWHRQGTVLRGRAEVLQALQRRPPDRQIRHVITNAFVESGTAFECHATAYQIVYLQASAGPDGVRAPTAASKISVVSAQLRCETVDCVWRIARLSSRLGLDLQGG